MVVGEGVHKGAVDKWWGMGWGKKEKELERSFVAISTLQKDHIRSGDLLWKIIHFKSSKFTT